MMNKKLLEVKRIAVFLAGIYAVSIPAIANANWSITALNVPGKAHDAAIIKDPGQVVKGRFIADPNGVDMTDLGAFKTKPDIFADSRASVINESGQVMGRSEARGNNLAFITGPNGVGMTSLGTLGGPKSSGAAINDSGQVVGMAHTPSERHAFIFSNGGMTDLSFLDVVLSGGWEFRQVTDINNNGQIVGFGEQDGLFRLFLLSFSPDTEFTSQPIFIPIIPVPEPETYVILLTGLGLMGFAASWRRNPNIMTI